MQSKLQTKFSLLSFLVFIAAAACLFLLFRDSYTFLLTLLVLFLGTVLNILIFKAAVASPLSRSIGVMKKNGEGDLSQRITLKSFDELGVMAHSFNRVVEQLKQLVMTIETEGENLDDVAIELSGHISQTAAAVHEISAAIETIKDRTVFQAASVSQTNSAMEQITVNIAELNDQVVIQSDSVSRSSSAIEEMLTNIDSVARICRMNMENADRLAEAASVGRSGLAEMAGDIKEIARESAGLLEINGVIQNIAGRTNLLAMNAAIEAAHAGEAGKGFAVVADEIRNLAENASKQSKTIGTVLKKITDSIAVIQEAAGGVLGKFEAIDTGVKTVVEQEDRIRQAMEEQTAGSRQILDAVEKLNEITRKVKSSAGEMRQESGEVIREGKNLETAAAEISAGVGEIAARTNQVNDSVLRLREIGGKNRANLEVLNRAVSPFRVSSSFYSWDDSFVSDVWLIDARHKRLFEAINRLIDACEQGAGREALAASLQFLSNYTVKHFSEEEELQQKFGYPDYPAHYQLHENFKKTVRDFSLELETRGASEALIERLKKEVGGWLVNHVKLVDIKMASIIRGNGAE
jgi:methyl-accepting chemotaxis protein